MGTSNIPTGIIKFPIRNVLSISYSDKSDNSDMFSDMEKFLFFNYLSLGQKLFCYLAKQQSQFCQFWNGKFVQQSVNACHIPDLVQAKGAYLL